MSGSAYILSSVAQFQPKISEGVVYGNVIGINTRGLFQNGITPQLTDMKFIIGYMLAAVNNNIYYAIPEKFITVYKQILQNYKYIYRGTDPVSCIQEYGKLGANCFPIAGLDGELTAGVIGEYKSTQLVSPDIIQSMITHEMAVPNTEIHYIGLEIPVGYLGSQSETEVVALAYGSTNAYISTSNGQQQTYTGGFVDSIIYSGEKQYVPQLSSGTLGESPTEYKVSEQEVTVSLGLSEGILIDGEITCNDVTINNQSICNIIHGLESNSVPVFQVYKFIMNNIFQCQPKSSYSYYNNFITGSTNNNLETITYAAGIDIATVFNAAGQQVNSIQITIPANTPYTKVNIGIY